VGAELTSRVPDNAKLLKFDINARLDVSALTSDTAGGDVLD